MKLTSKSDVITNSSTEIYTYISTDGLQKIRDLATALMSYSRDDLCFDDIFEIKPFIDDYDKDYVLQDWRDENPGSPEPGLPELIDYALAKEDENYDIPRVSGYKINIKPGLESKKTQKIKELLEELHEGFFRKDMVYS